MLPDAEEGYALPAGVAASKAGSSARGSAPQLGDLTAQAPWPDSCWAELHDGSSSLHWGRQVRRNAWPMERSAWPVEMDAWPHTD